ncbi:MAG: hypothetical protein A2521_16145 [Deltaproteobacteria bacterium RIFOXYD12_FULL_57_12]|nr:MAG: hypothetical protein A2521_16145 [Deltaproteobacteria bacterium RIFOXYD12_FULL_57_12]
MTNWKKMLVAADGGETSRRALRFVGEIVGGNEALHICLLYVFPEPPPQFLQEGGILDQYRQEKELAADRVFTEAIAILTQMQFPAERITTACRMTAGETISQAILRERAEGDYGIVVVGKRGVSKAEEFLFGSISNTVVRQCNGFAAWVVS